MSKPVIYSPSRWNRPFALMLVLLFAEAQMVALAGNDAPARDAGLVDSSFQCQSKAVEHAISRSPAARTPPSRPHASTACTQPVARRGPPAAT